MWFWQATAMLFHDQQARSAGSSRGSEGVKGGKNYHFWFNGRTEFCQIFMTLRNDFGIPPNQ